MEEESGFFNGATVEPTYADGVTGMTMLYESKSGAFRIYTARHAGRRVVIKTIGPSLREDPLRLAQLRKEFELGFAVDNPSVCRTLAFLTLAGNTPAIEQEYCEGVSLRTLIDHLSDTGSETSLPSAADSLPTAKRLSAPSGKSLDTFVGNLLKGLEAIHDAGIVHRDIKPSNIIFDAIRSTVKIIDFGCADATDQLLLKSPAGTPRYTREQGKGQELPPLPSDDLYALGMTLLELSAVLTDSSDRKRLSRFSRRLINGDFSSASEAREGWNDESGRKKRIAILISSCAIFLLVCVGVIFLVLSRNETRHDIPAIGSDEPAGTSSPALPASDVSSPEPIGTPPSPETSSGTSSIPGDGLEGGRSSNAESSNASTESTPSYPDAASRPADIPTPATTDLYMEAVAAGPLLRKYKDGTASSSERADALAISLADSIYYKVMKNELLSAGWPKYSAKEIDRLTDRKVEEYLPILRRNLSGSGVDSRDFDRRRKLFRHRLHYILSSYHLAQE